MQGRAGLQLRFGSFRQEFHRRILVRCTFRNRETAEVKLSLVECVSDFRAIFLGDVEAPVPPGGHAHRAIFHQLGVLRAGLQPHRDMRAQSRILYSARLMPASEAKTL